MAFSKKHKQVLLAQYEEWANKSQAIFVLSYNKMTVKDTDMLRAKVREAGGELHVVKNTLMVMALDKAGIQHGKLMEGTSLMGFAMADAAALAKALSDATAKSEIFAMKGGYLDRLPITAKQVKSLAELPPLPVIRAQILGVITMPATKLVRTLAEPARSMAGVVKAYSEKEAAPAA
ncbi:LSU ribosomal protein L10P [Longilinea arvoryzae]|uniref:Large ribosomal subunit protein uL10 n=1 Tax=Longilinea arvoryzae TaxID=360412 RepID=A0A0S7BCY6_9CHLR|nr:50S ribosomal protein L10 [Longilinea arvoryzae]GAP13129.1 LSU ribosomal protein L10P [Longilinea arvoryzae]